jgi:low temperature requirement protein LtrA
VAALLGAGVFAGLLWWSYFDRPNPAVERRHDAIEHGIDRGRFARDVYTIAHFPIIGGVLLAAVALEEITAHPADPLPAAFRWMLFAGLALYLGGVVATVARAFRALAVERSVALPVLLLVVLAGAEVDGIALLAIVNAVLAVMLIVEHHRIERFGITIRPRVSG